MSRYASLFASGGAGVVLGLLVALSPSCSGTPPCGPSTCYQGCCNAAGVCQPGNVDTDCGNSGGTCATCLGNQSCLLGYCVTPSGGGDSGMCSPLGVSCVTPTQCCSRNCLGGFCQNQTSCNAANCNGCCDVNGSCQVGTLPTACGINGNACADCANIGTCQAGFCQGMGMDAGAPVPLGASCVANTDCGGGSNGDCLMGTGQDGGPSGFPGGYCIGICQGACSTSTICLNNGTTCIEFEPCTTPGTMGICRAGYICDQMSFIFGGAAAADAGEIIGTGAACVPLCSDPGVPGCPPPRVCQPSGLCR